MGHQPACVQHALLGACVYSKQVGTKLVMLLLQQCPMRVLRLLCALLC